MLQISRKDVQNSPFPHVVKQGILPADLYARLRAEFPTYKTFNQQNDEVGGLGSRVGRGFDIYRGDESYDALIARSDAWAEFDAFINSSAFVDQFLEIFGPDLKGLGCSISIEPSSYDRKFVEGREVLKEKAGFGDRLKRLLGLGGAAKAPAGPVKLFTRLDLEKSIGGYMKPPHCDRGNRVCSLIVYFSDLEAQGIKGGELNIYKHKTKTVASEHERHPDIANVDVVATLAPKENLGVFFPCSSNSYHGVNALATQDCERDFLYINISADCATCW
jgi:2OG-Fe(II) oxygenase superfamily